jgi:CRP-like cAMP-binding protein
MICLRIVEKYFTHADRCLNLDSGQTLISAGAVNDRLFYVKSGRLRGSMLGPNGAAETPLVILPGDLAGLQSFFVHPHKSTATLVTDAPTTLHWVSQNDFAPKIVPERELMPLLTHTMARRQHLIQVLQEEQQHLHQQAAQAERFELLGQFSAGVAHELNNALAVVEQSNSFLMQHLNVQRLGLKLPTN